MAAANQASHGKKVIYIDTEGGFSMTRLKQITNQDVLKNIFLIKSTNFPEQCEAFNKLLSIVNKNVGLIVVDSMVMLYRLEIGQAKQEGDSNRAMIINRALAKQMRILNEIARKKNIPVIITDQVYGEFLSEEDFKAGKQKQVAMVGGDILKYWSKCILELQNLGQQKRKAILKKHRSLPQKEFSFIITDKGITKEKKLGLF
jgi:DNA repair protein RadB